MYEQESSKPYECDVCKIPYFERNNYFHGKTLSARELKAEQTYFNEKRWLINRMILGWGIVCGLGVYAKHGCLYIEPGLALDCCGHELLVCERESIHVGKIAEELCPHGSDESIEWALCLEYYECKTEPIKVPASCDDKKRGPEHNRIRDHYRLSIRNLNDVCLEDHCHDDCGLDLGHTTPIHKEMVERSLECPKCKDCECVLLATGTLKARHGQKPEVTLEENYWRYRRIVYTNPALANLIRCFHGPLAHITQINWKPDSRYDVDEFLEQLSVEHLKIRFDRPLDKKTVENTKSFRLSVFISQGEGSCPFPYLIPLERVEYNEHENVAVYYFDADCIEHDLRTSCKKLKKSAQVELVLHGDMIRDLNHRALDAELINDFPTGNGVQGGQFITYFTVGPVTPDHYRAEATETKEASS